VGTLGCLEKSESDYLIMQRNAPGRNSRVP
jgi:hypothetical protein